MEVTTCRICGQESQETRHLPLYAFGSEGVEACLDCLIILTELVRGMAMCAGQGRRIGYKAAKEIAAAKSNPLKEARA